MPRMDMVEATRGFRSTCPGVQVLIWAAASDEESILAVIRREEKVLHSIAAGRFHPGIAGELFIAETRVKTRIDDLFAAAGSCGPGSSATSSGTIGGPRRTILPPVAPGPERERTRALNGAKPKMATDVASISIL